MSKSKLLLGAVYLSAWVIGVAHTGIPTVEERVSNSSLNPEYYEPWSNWRASSRRLPAMPSREETWAATACYRRDFTLTGEPRLGQMSFNIPFWRDGYEIVLNGHNLLPTGLGKHEFRSFDITSYLRKGRNTLTITGSGSDHG